MGNLNKVFLMGNLTRDPEIRYAQSGTAVTNVGLAINRRVKDRSTDQWRDEVDFVNAVFFGVRGEKLAQFFRKGSPILIEGSLRYSSWETPQGERRSKLEVVGDNWEFCGRGEGGGGGGSSNEQGGYQQSPPPQSQSNYPQSAPPPQQSGPPPQRSAPPPPPNDLPPYDESAFADDDVPF
ncbi:MAG: single-stranded DNA-binding protein [Planctomycetota bacterium]|nr:single-stranded DNA-binding protein [Planctomycetota bacterium]MDA1142100.1 single-stranded DNA-binding protein [Planctomycetota bacterium]